MVSTYQARWLVAALLMINVAAAFTADAQPQCTLPADPGTLPQGASATQAQMLDAQQRIRDFNFLTEQYLRCVRSETDQAQLGKDAATREQLMSERIVAHNAAQAKLMGYANCFNEQLRAFKASGGGSGALAADCSAQLAGAAAGSESNAASAGLLHAPLQVPRSRLGSTLVCERTM